MRRPAAGPGLQTWTATASSANTSAAAAALIVGSAGGPVLRVIRRGAPAVPILVADVVAVPCLALFPVGILFADARYALPLPPQLSMGLGAWFLMLPARLRSFAVIAAVPTTWAIVLCVPVQHHQARVDDAGPGWGGQTGRPGVA